METEFKPHAISLFERMFGAYDKDYSGKTLPQYVKEYINDINGNPSTTEELINKTLNKCYLYRKLFVPAYGERAALTVTNAMTGRVSYLCLGFGNFSSALLNFTQLTNAAGYLGGWGRLMKHFKRFNVNAANRKLLKTPQFTMRELKVLADTGTLNDIGLDTATGYDKNRGYGGSSIPIVGKAISAVDRFGNWSMGFFQYCDTACRVSATLAAFEQAREKGKSYREAIEFARDVNIKANFNYGVHDAPNVFRRGSVIGKAGLQFMKYSFKQMEVLADFMPWNGKTTKMQKAMFWFPYLLTCGLMGLPFLDWLDDLLGEKRGIFPKDFLQECAMDGARAVFGDGEIGKMAAKMATRRA